MESRSWTSADGLNALRVYGGTSDLAGEREHAERVSAESLKLYRSLEDDRGVAAVLHRLAVSAWRREDWKRVRELTEEGLDRSRGRFVEIEIAGYWLLGQLRLTEGDVAGAIELTRQSAGMARDIGWKWWESGQLHELLMLALRSGDVDAAEREGRVALRLERAQENRLWSVYTLAGLVQAALVRGDVERGGLLWGAADEEASRLPSWDGERAKRGGALVHEEDPHFIAATNRGRDLDLWDAAAIALGEDDQTVP